MDEMKLLQDFCAAEPSPPPQRLAHARSELIDAIGRTGSVGSRRTRWRPGARTPDWSRHQGIARGWRGWVIPLAAAAAVVAVVTLPLAVISGHAPVVVSPSLAASGPAGAPPFYMAAPESGRYAVIAATATGKALVLIRPPRGTRSIGPVGAAASDRTFVLGASKSKQGVANQFFLVRFHPQTKTASLTRLPFRFTPPHDTAVGMTLSPDASTLAVIEFKLGVKRSILAVTTYALATGSSRTWTRKVPGLSPQTSSQVWSPDGRQVQVAWQNSIPLPGPVFTDRLDTAAPGNRLPRPVELPTPSSLTRILESISVAPNGDVFLPAGAYRPTWTLTEFSPRTDQLTRILGPVRHTKITPIVQWSSNSGHVLIISGKDGGLGVLHNGRYLPLPLGILRNPWVSAVW